MSAGIEQVRHVQLGAIKLEIHSSRTSMGAAAARAAAEVLKELERVNETVGAIFATGVSQLDTLDALTRIQELPWDRVCGFHLDEYVGLPIDHPAS